MAYAREWDNGACKIRADQTWLVQTKKLGTKKKNHFKASTHTAGKSISPTQALPGGAVRIQSSKTLYIESEFFNCAVLYFGLPYYLSQV